MGLVIHWNWEATHSHLVIWCEICHHPWFPEDSLLLGAVLRHLWWQWISRGVCGCSLQCRQQMPPKYPAGSWRSSFWTRQYYIFHCAMAAMTMALASSDPASNSFALRSETSELASEKISGCVWWGAVEGGAASWVQKEERKIQHILENTLWLFNLAMENGPFIDGLPIKNGDVPWLCWITRWYPMTHWQSLTTDSFPNLDLNSRLWLYPRVSAQKMYCLRRLFKSTQVSRNASMMSSPCLWKWGIPPKLHFLFLCTELVLATDHVETTRERERERERERREGT